MIYIIGCGGVGSWICPSLCLLTDPQQVVVIDGDKLEEGNLNRQLFTEDEIGQNKADALAKKYGCRAWSDWYNVGVIAHEPEDWLIVAVDNSPARVAALAACDQFRCSAIVAANETTSAEAYVYRSEWKGTRLDPRVMYPDLLTDREGDPQAAAIGCTGVVQQAKRQLVSANFMAASLAQHLYVAWAIELPKMTDPEIAAFLPHHLVSNMTHLISKKRGELKNVTDVVPA